MALSLNQARLNIDYPLTHLSQKIVQPEFVMKLFYPLAEVASYGGQILQFGDDEFEDVDDTRDDDSPYPEVQFGYEGQPFKLETKGLSTRIGDKIRREFDNLKINWGQVAVDTITKKAGLRHEIEGATRATNPANYATTNRITLTAGSQFNEANVDPDPVIRMGKSAVADRIGLEPNVMGMGRPVFDALASKYSKLFTSTDSPVGMRQQLTLDILASIYGFERAVICDAKRKVNGANVPIFGKHIVMAYTNPAALKADRLPLKPMGAINVFTPAFGYTYVMKDNPYVFPPYRDEDRSATVYKMDFDRKVVNTGRDKQTGLITHGYLIANAVA